ncbi:hypothetical protein PMG11_06060 [Penicillium brasilianum]|uniref:Cell wall protein n=1 Tax=Penicillium brasilianum TaxID=104259 RepID=A0A0F7TPL2_PENBI|nr:hypothetical protein PMG11_06060 [Penicillium brasilianum]
MRSDLLLLATLASSALAYPTEVAVERRTFGLLASLLGDAAADVIGLVDSLLGVGVHGSVSVLAGLSAHGAAALEGGVLGCTAGVIHAGARAQLKAWLAGQTHISGSLKTSLLAWCEGSGSATLSADVIAALSVYIPTCADIAAKESIYVTVDGIFSSAELSSTLVLSASAQTTLSAFLDVHVGLGADIQAGLSVCAAGGVIASLEADVKASLIAWLNASDCPLEAALKASILGWCHGSHASGLVEIGAIADTALTAISVGASVGANVEETGALSVHAQASLAAFLNTNLAIDIDAEILVYLKACAGGKLAASLDADARAALAVWLSGSSCSLGVELKAIVLLWLSVSATAEASLDLVSGLFVDISGFLTETIIASLSINLRGALGLLAGGESLATLNWDARAELAAFLAGCTGIDVSVSIQLIIIEWFTGCRIPSAPAPSSAVSSLPSATPVGVSSTPLIPSGSTPTGSVPSVSIPSGGVPTGPAASGSVTVPSGSIPTGSGSGSSGSGSSGSGSSGSGSGSGSVTVPSGSIPTGPAGGVPGNGASSTPCDTETIPVVTSTVIPGGPAATGHPAGPTETGAGAASTPCETAPTGTSPTGTPGSGSSGSGSTGSGWSSSGSSESSWTWSAGGAPAPTAAPTGSGSGWASDTWTETVTIYHTVCDCE